MVVRSAKIILKQHLILSILPTEFTLGGLLQSSQYSSKFHCFRLKKGSEVVGKADMNNIPKELSFS